MVNFKLEITLEVKFGRNLEQNPSLENRNLYTILN